jgi:hypothetical protein
MKKTYISPNMVVVKLAMTQPLASSPTATIGSGSVNAEDVQVRGFNGVIIWDDEW